MRDIQREREREHTRGHAWAPACIPAPPSAAAPNPWLWWYPPISRPSPSRLPILIYTTTITEGVFTLGSGSTKFGSKSKHPLNVPYFYTQDWSQAWRLVCQTRRNIIWVEIAKIQQEIDVTLAHLIFPYLGPGPRCTLLGPNSCFRTKSSLDFGFLWLWTLLISTLTCTRRRQQQVYLLLREEKCAPRQISENEIRSHASTTSTTSPSSPSVYCLSLAPKIMWDASGTVKDRWEVSASFVVWLSNPTLRRACESDDNTKLLLRPELAFGKWRKVSGARNGGYESTFPLTARLNY